MKNYIKLTNKDVQSFSNDKLRSIMNENECIVKVYSDNCIHCTNMLPQWNKFLQKMQTKPKVYVIDIEADYFSNMEHSGVKDEVIGFPTIMHVHKNRTDVYNGERESAKMYDWSMSKIKDSLDVHRSRMQKKNKTNKKYKKRGNKKGKRNSKYNRGKQRRTKRQRGKSVRFRI